MLTDWETYKAKSASWEDLRKKVFDASVEEDGFVGKDPSFTRTLLLQNRYACTVFGYDKVQRIQALYIGIQNDEGKELLEARLGLELEVRPDLERILTPEEIAHAEEADKRRTPSPSEI